MTTTILTTPVTLEGRRVIALPLTEAHAEPFFRYRQHPEYRNMPYNEWFETYDDALAYVRKALDGQRQGHILPFAIQDRESGEIVGLTRFADVSASNRSLEIGWTSYDPAVWRTRVNTETKYLLLRHAFETMGVIRVQLKTDLRNERSQKAIARLGAVREGVLRKHMIREDGYQRSTVMFSIVDDEWPGVKNRLESFLGGELPL